MTVNIAAVGKIKEDYLTKGIAEYAKRISAFAELRIHEINDEHAVKESSGGITQALKKESERLSQKLKGYVIALDSSGANLSSVALSEKIASLKTSGISEITFVIGGSYGLDDIIKKNADFLLSFGKNTYPHQLMRLMLSEQIYRAFTIEAGHPYHK